LFYFIRHYDRYFGKALRVRRLIANDFYRLFRPKQFGANDDSNRIDALLTPVASQTAPAYSQFNAGSYERERCDDYFTQPANMAGLSNHYSLFVICFFRFASNIDTSWIGIQWSTCWCTDNH
jgi:Asp-tRNA(Asn)/Glu-tRNA(Gln) amidotransferase A subunit family amidase